MNKQVAFLRAINVGGHATVKMSDLKRAFEAAGCAGVRTYIQSGNVIFEPAKATAALNRRIQEKLFELVGSEVTVAFRTVGELQDTVTAAPFNTLAS